jgi:hypothetical protein
LQVQNATVDLTLVTHNRKDMARTGTAILDPWVARK